MIVAAEELVDVVTREQIVVAKRFVGQCCILDPQLITPMRLLWQAFRTYHPRASAVALRALLEASPWSRVEELGGRGRIRVMAHGIAVKDHRDKPDVSRVQS